MQLLLTNVLNLFNKTTDIYLFFIIQGDPKVVDPLKKIALSLAYCESKNGQTLS
jgi:hypothetical protein